jgi:D-inositol-3-phosphate glycosyltransferase
MAVMAAVIAGHACGQVGCPDRPRARHVDCQRPGMKPLPALRIAMISEHASPLAAAGGVDSGGRNVYVAEVARCLAEAGHRVDVFTRRDDTALPALLRLPSGARVVHVDAGPPRFVPKEELLPFMPAFAGAMCRAWPRVSPYDVVHANFFMSGKVGLLLRQRYGTPLVTTFHALGLVRREHQKQADRFPPERIDIERELVRHSDRIVAACPQDESDLVRLYGASPSRLMQVPCGVDVMALRPGSRAQARQRLGLPADEFIVLAARPPGAAQGHRQRRARDGAAARGRAAGGGGGRRGHAR